MTALPPVILLHGWGGSFAKTFGANGWIEAFEAAGRSVGAMDLPGHGGPGSSNPADYTDLTGAILEKFTDSPVDLVAFSLGAKIALAAAAREPTRVRRIVLGGVGNNVFAAEAQGDALADILDSGAIDGLSGPVASLAAYARASGNDVAALAAVLRRPANPVLTDDQIARITARVLLVNGTLDTIALPDERLRSALPGSRYLALPETGHVDLPSSATFRAAAIQFLCSDEERNPMVNNDTKTGPRAPQLYNWNDLPREFVRRGIERCGLGGENVLCQFGWVEPGAEIRPHSHDFEQVVMILEGECIYHVGGVPHQCRPGSFIRVPAHTEHYIEVRGSQTVLNLDIFAPVRDDLAYLLDHQKAEWQA